MDKSSANRRYPIPAAGNLAIVAAQVLAWATIVFLIGRASAAWHFALLCLVFVLAGNSIYATVHEAVHGMLHPNRRVNDAIGSLLALLFPVPFHLLRQGHIGHHLRNRSDDEAFDFYFPGESPALKRLQFYGILTGLYYLTVVASNVVVLLVPGLLQKRYFRFDRPSAALMESLNPALGRILRLEAAAAIVLHLSVLILVGIPPVWYALVYFSFGWSWSAMQYVHHFGTERHVIRGTRNLRVAGWIDAIWLHHNWHLTHHSHPTVPWCYLPDLGRTEGPDRDFLPWHYLKMWRGPKQAADSVENRYAGRIIR